MPELTIKRLTTDAELMAVYPRIRALRPRQFAFAEILGYFFKRSPDEALVRMFGVKQG